LLGEPRQLGLAAQAGEVGIDLPGLRRFADRGAGFGPAAIEELGPGRQLVLEPAEGSATGLDQRGFVGLGVILPRTAAGRRGGPGRIAWRLADRGANEVGQAAVDRAEGPVDERVVGTEGRLGGGMADLTRGQAFCLSQLYRRSGDLSSRRVFPRRSS